MEAQREQATSAGSCPSCGAPLEATAARCPVCGWSTRVEAGVPAAATEPGEPVPAPVPAVPGPNEWRCSWCETINPLGAARCTACGAAYPRSDQDALMQRAAEARIQTALDEIEIRERIRPKSFWKRMFG